MKPIKRINKPIKFWGLTSTQAGLYVLCCASVIIVTVFMGIHPILIACVALGMMLLTQVAFQRFVREHKAGNPDYLKGLNVRELTPKQITDKHQIFKTIIRK